MYSFDVSLFLGPPNWSYGPLKPSDMPSYEFLRYVRPANVCAKKWRFLGDEKVEIFRLKIVIFSYLRCSTSSRAVTRLTVYRPFQVTRRASFCMWSCSKSNTRAVGASWQKWFVEQVNRQHCRPAPRVIRVQWVFGHPFGPRLSVTLACANCNFSKSVSLFDSKIFNSQAESIRVSFAHNMVSIHSLW